MQSPATQDALTALHQAIGENAGSRGKVRAFRKNGAVHIEIVTGDGTTTIALPDAEAAEIGAAIYHLAGGRA